MTNAQKFIEEKLLPEIKRVLALPVEAYNERAEGYDAALKFVLSLLADKSEWQSPVSVGEIKPLGSACTVFSKINELVDVVNELRGGK